MKLYSVCDGPPSLTCRTTLKALNIPYELIDISYNSGEHFTDEYAKLNPQRQIPVLDDDGFLLSEHIAISQYLCDKYAPNASIFPQDPNVRALITQRMCFNMAYLYPPILRYAIDPIFFDYQRDAEGLKKVQDVLSTFEEYLKRVGKKYAVSDNVTIADFAFVSTIICLEAVEITFDEFPLITKWYNNFKKENPEEWAVAEEAMKLITEYEKNTPDLSKLNHPVHPRKIL
ncbi:CLUMA_CG012508, isoform A [Clunio marinus]|uniref:glutathione transferase n=1 Tax=Clunio marinus TaxID=568069 RepID=A0A1J1IHA0_9DIPT|nr:CLUMA_CG012508, isoform A [Clunio marinus]